MYRRTNESARAYYADVRERRKAMAVEYKGGACQRCGYNRCIDALEFHHIDDANKSFPIGSRIYAYPWRRIVEELDKCIMVCANCHREMHVDNRPGPPRKVVDL